MESFTRAVIKNIFQTVVLNTYTYLQTLAYPSGFPRKTILTIRTLVVSLSPWLSGAECLDRLKNTIPLTICTIIGDVWPTDIADISLLPRTPLSTTGVWIRPVPRQSPKTQPRSNTFTSPVGRVHRVKRTVIWSGHNDAADHNGSPEITTLFRNENRFSPIGRTTDGRGDKS